MFLAPSTLFFWMSTFAVLSEGEQVRVVADHADSRFVIIAGTPLREPVCKHGPFVMNTREEIEQAFADYYAGKF